MPPSRCARLGGDALEPRNDERELREVEATLVRDVGVGVEGDVGERQRVADEVLPAVEMPLHRRERLVPRGRSRRQSVGERLGPAGVGEPEPRHRDGRLVVVLLEEHPLEDLRALIWVVRDEARALAEEP